MHPRNPYASHPPDFQALAAFDPDNFGRHVRTRKDGRFYIDFKDLQACKALNEAILLHDFGIKVNQPADRLCPPVPNRLNYLLWLQDVLRESKRPDGRPVVEFGGDEAARSLKSVASDSGARMTKRMRVQSPDASTIRTLDIGTGATAIYPILGCALSPHWTFDATEIDSESLANAQTMIDDPCNNGEAPALACAQRRTAQGPLQLKSRIRLILRTAEDTLIPTEDQNLQASSELLYHCTMSNPPFYSSSEDLAESAAAKLLPPQSACTGTDGEMITPGGEVAFVTRQIEESIVLGQRVLWYSSMLGKLSSVSTLLQTLKEKQIDNIAVTKFQQGQTGRWAIAWSLSPHRLPDWVGRSMGDTAASGWSTLVSSTSIFRTLPTGRFESLQQAEEALFKLLNSLDAAQVSPQEPEDPSSGRTVFVGLAYNVWNRAARRAAKASAEATAITKVKPDVEPVLCLLISLSQQRHRRTEVSATPASSSFSSSPPVEVKMQWTYGRSRLHFESFATMLIRSLSSRG
ncbi:hypothetical protein BCV69DRAFT_298827 [Microstroma glucosiphilum]|uniref:Uncharacterized protein n=1 Tax=Pseudomicrostroma glucosiphilum TaxID=1684307 RepID=A0A316U6Z9_9BASI|nr:hypothetical protein BCV69DRAFT_298827 [Pseudomicrostroma glucosiphilum]PWN21036.1 hypothetical protein BCV69DRAFT_298827 [Pseudomicrostroma glucosiphilum]